MKSTDDRKIPPGSIGVFDSGVGGISTLRALKEELPHEHFLYFGDSLHAPYGEKSVEQVQQYSMEIAEYFVHKGCKAIVIACNTATSAAAALIRSRYQDKIPIIGIEPALKPAAKADKDQNSPILVMATPVTLSLEKFQKLEQRLSHEAHFIPVACPGLAGRIEKGDLDAPDVIALLQSLIGKYKGTINGIVLGCTHYPFVKAQIQSVMGNVPLYDGREGTARELRRVLTERNSLSSNTGEGQVLLQSSLNTEEEQQIYEYLYKEAPL